MLEITPDKVTPSLIALFDPQMPTYVRAMSALAGGICGRILVDDATTPSWAMVWEADDGTLYRGGSYTPADLAAAIDLLRQDSLAALPFRPDDPCVEDFPPNPDAGADCLEFDRPVGASDLSAFLSPLPPGFTLQRMDWALLERSSKKEINLVRYGSIQHFLQTGLAVCILNGSETVCEAYADLAVNGVREIGITTQPTYRRQGFAAIACAHLIQHMENEGNAAFWDCARLNAGSRALAHKLGFQNARPYRLLAWFAPRPVDAFHIA
jgi:RimJ/RimL family protein N-acetyltransferase